MKIKSIHLHNLRAYKDEVIDFTDGLNTIVGSTDAGKSAIRTGLEFVISNNQAGNIVSNYIKDENGKIIKGETCYVELTTIAGDVIRRERSRSDNFYQINGGKPIKNFGTGVPEDVEAIFNMSEINFQNQFATHFMLAENASAVAKTLNKMVDLEIIDKTTANINSIVRKINQDKTASDSNIENYKKSIEKFDFISKMEEDVNALWDMENKKTLEVETHKTLVETKNAITNCMADLEKVITITKHEKLVQNILTLYRSKELLTKKRNDLSNIKKDLKDYEKSLKDLNKIIASKPICDKLLVAMNDSSLKVKRYNSLVNCVEEIEEYESSLVSINAIVKNTNTVNTLINLYTKRNDLLNEHVRLHECLSNINKYKEESNALSKLLSKSYKEIQGEACPTCGKPMDNLKGECNG